MSSVQSAFAQRKTNGFVVNSSASVNLYSLADLTTQLAAVSATQIGSVFVAPTAAAIVTAFAAASSSVTAAASSTLTDIGKTIVIEAAGTDAYVTLREVKYMTAVTTFVTGFVVVDNNWNLASGNKIKVLVARV